MVRVPAKTITLEEFLASPDSDGSSEFFDGEVIPKVSPKRSHAALQKAFIKLLDNWAQGKGHFYPEWAIVVDRAGKVWVPVPDLTYVSFDRLSADWLEDEPCPVPADLAIEIISPGQTFGEMITKATDYLAAGVSRVWIVDSKAQTITVFFPDRVPATFQGDDIIRDTLFSDLELRARTVFEEAGLS